MHRGLIKASVFLLLWHVKIPLAKIKEWFIIKKKGGKVMEKSVIVRHTGGGG